MAVLSFNFVQQSPIARRFRVESRYDRPPHSLAEIPPDRAQELVVVIELLPVRARARHVGRRNAFVGEHVRGGKRILTRVVVHLHSIAKHADVRVVVLALARLQNIRVLFPLSTQ